MMFDRLCGIVERVYRNEPLMRVLKSARLFEFPGRLHEVSQGRDWESFGGSEFLLEHFFLPFPVVAVEDTASCVVIVDEEPDQRGLNCARTIIECLDLNAPLDEFGASKHDPAQIEAWSTRDLDRFKKGTCSVAISRLVQCNLAADAQCRENPGATGLVFGGNLGTVFVANKNEMVFPPLVAVRALQDRNDWDRHEHAAIMNGVAALEEIMWFNTPDRFIVERSPDAPLKNGKQPNEILRSGHRPHYILLTPSEIRQRLGMGDDPVNERKSPTPHARRRHYRTLKSDRYVNSQGKTVVVSASWIGPQEGEYRNRRYRVCLEL